ncbi:MAG: C39 family peptidase [Chloroflexota bacterium]|nr:MAG: hypothetical protein KatS3mg047_1267 [Bellilinea sp.]
MNNNNTAQRGSIVPLPAFGIGLILVLIVLIIAGFKFFVSQFGPFPQYITPEYVPQFTPTLKIALAFGGYPETPTPFQPLPTHTSTPIPTPSPTAQPIVEPNLQPSPQLPPFARIEDIRGYPQTLNLSCESRSAADWAAYFGVSIEELDFLSQLPHSDDPNKGFVGDPNGPGGLIPPHPYGVHAAPVAALLRAYGLPAEDVMDVTIEELKAEIAAGRPVIVWVIFGTSPGYALSYTTQAGEVITVAPNEHTAILIGYDPNGVTLLDGAMIYWRSWDTFLQSFKVLGNMAVFYRHP